MHDDSILVKDCYAILCDNYESEFYYLPKKLKDEFEAWKAHLDKVLSKYSESHRIDGLSIDPIMQDATMTLKKNTRFGRSPSSSSNLYKEIQKIINEISLGSDRVEVLIESALGFYTHVPSILESIKHVLVSMDNNTGKKNKIFIDILKTHRRIELRIFDKSKD